MMVRISVIMGISVMKGISMVGDGHFLFEFRFNLLLLCVSGSSGPMAPGQLWRGIPMLDSCKGPASVC